MLTRRSFNTLLAAWRSKPSWYQISTEDRTTNPDLERFLAKRMGATTIELASSQERLFCSIAMGSTLGNRETGCLQETAVA
jgi:hypothetical protein